MTTIVTVASGKGGVGKSVVVTNLGLALAARGRRVVLADLDVGGANLATLFGEFEAGPDLGAFLARDIRDLESARRPLRRNLSLIAGGGETLATASPNWAMKQRLLRQLANLDADVVLIDVGAGANNHALDFFNSGDLRIIVTVPEPTASVDAYRFVKLATIRESVRSVPTRNPVRRRLERRDYGAARDLWRTVEMAGSERAGAGGDPVERRPDPAIPWVIVNQALGAKRAFERLQLVVRRFLGRDLQLLGEIPRSGEVVASVSDFLPVVESAPDSRAAEAFRAIAGKLDHQLARLAPVRPAALPGWDAGRQERRAPLPPRRRRRGSEPDPRFESP